MFPVDINWLVVITKLLILRTFAKFPSDSSFLITSSVVIKGFKKNCLMKIDGLEYHSSTKNRKKIGETSL